MAHNLNFKNGKAAMMYYGEKPWHKLGTELDRPATAQEAIEAAQLDYTVEKFPLLATTNGRNGLIQVPDQFATMRTDTWEVLGTVGNEYEVVQNVSAFNFFDTLVGDGEAIYHTAGALGKGERIWILAKMPDYIKVNGDDIVEKYLLLTTGHDGRNQIKARLTPIRVVCNNTLTMALQGSEQEVRIIHTSGVHERLAAAHRLLGLSNDLYAQLGNIFQQMSLKSITDKQLMEYVNKLIPDNPDIENNTRRENQRQAILDIHATGLGAEMARGTVWGAYNAVTEYTDHQIGWGKADDDARLNYVWFGGGADLKAKAFTEAVELI